MFRKAKTVARLLKELNRLQSIDGRLGSIEHQIMSMSSDTFAGSDCRAVSFISKREVGPCDSNFTQFFGSRIPIFLTANGSPALAPPGQYPFKAMVISAPKAGTYFLGAFLEELGWMPTNCHLSEDSFTDYRFITIQRMIEEVSKLQIPIPLDRSLHLIQPGQFAVGHIVHQASSVELLREFRCLFIYREMRASLVSFMRWSRNKGRAEEFDTTWKQINDDHDRMTAFMQGHCARFLASVGSVAAWIDEDAVFPLRFETLSGDEGLEASVTAVLDAARHLGVRKSRDEIAEALERATARPTKTWSGERSSLDRYWDDRSEAIFRAAGGDELNARFGYPRTKTTG